MIRATTDLPVRQLTRLRSEMHIAVAQHTGRMFPDRFVLGIEYGAVARYCLRDWVQDGAVGPPTTATRAIAVHKLALSLGQPTESVRRRVGLLRDRGALTASAEGVSLPVAGEGVATATRYLTAVHDQYLRLMDGVSATCDLDLPSGGPAMAGSAMAGPADVIERALDMLLMPIDTYRPAAMPPVGLLLWAALTVVANRRVTFDPALARQHADALAPDDLRASISLRRVAAALAVPYTTALRHMDDQRARGLVTRVDEHRWTVLTANQHGAMLDIAATPSRIFVGRLRELARMGLTPTLAGDRYLDGRPPLADFGA